MSANDKELPASRFKELPEETQNFLVQLRKEDIGLLKDGLELVRSLRTIGRFMRWVVVGILALMLGIVSLYENAVKMWGWFHK